MKVTMVLHGEKELMRALNRKRDQFLDVMRVGLQEEAARLLGAAESTTPTASGKLLTSLKLSSADQPTKGRVRFAVAYTDEKAAAVHEGVHWGQKVDHETGGFKWFEKAFNAWEPGAVDRILARLRALTGGGK